MFSTVYSGTLQGVDALSVQVEVKSDLPGDFRFQIVGLPDAAVKEASDRVLAALSNCRLPSPPTKTVVNLAPGNIRKEGPMYDLPIALALLAAQGVVPRDRLNGFIVAGELGLNGDVRAVRGGVSLALLALREGRSVVLPRQSAEEVALVEGVKVFPVDSLRECVDFFLGVASVEALSSANSAFRHRSSSVPEVDFSEVK